MFASSFDALGGIRAALSANRDQRTKTERKDHDHDAPSSTTIDTAIASTTITGGGDAQTAARFTKSIGSFAGGVAGGAGGAAGGRRARSSALARRPGGRGRCRWRRGERVGSTVGGAIGRGLWDAGSWIGEKVGNCDVPAAAPLNHISNIDDERITTMTIINSLHSTP